MTKDLSACKLRIQVVITSALYSLLMIISGCDRNVTELYGGHEPNKHLYDNQLKDCVLLEGGHVGYQQYNNIADIDLNDGSRVATKLAFIDTSCFQARVEYIFNDINAEPEIVQIQVGEIYGVDGITSSNHVFTLRVADSLLIEKLQAFNIASWMFFNETEKMFSIIIDNEIVAKYPLKIAPAPIIPDHEPLFINGVLLTDEEVHNLKIALKIYRHLQPINDIRYIVEFGKRKEWQY